MYVEIAARVSGRVDDLWPPKSILRDSGNSSCAIICSIRFWMFSQPCESEVKGRLLLKADLEEAVYFMARVIV